MIDVERFKKIDAIFQQALDLDPGERPLYISEACSGDESLRKEVEYLLGSDKRDLEILNIPAFEMAAPLMAKDRPELSAGERLGHYRIVSLLGAGGMAQVYLAEDTRLGRKVALKLLPISLIRIDSRLRRFQREARAASALNHPNILTIYDISEVEGRHLIATEYIEGETLRQRIKHANLTLEECLEISRQVANALSAAHQANIVHRDIKPENIMLRRDGLVKVLDFGLAKLVDWEAPRADASVVVQGKVERQLPADKGVVDRGNRLNTEAGLLVGTLPYMSPEQLRGDPLDAQTDIFSLGVVIYEMVAGRTPFEGASNDELIAAILNNEPEALPENLSSEVYKLKQIVDKTLCKNKEERYQTATDLLADLQNLQQEAVQRSRLEGSIESYPRNGRTENEKSTRWVRNTKILIACLLLSVFSAMLLYFLLVYNQRAKPATGRKSLAVLPFKSIVDDPADEYLRIGIADNLITKISNLRQMIVRPIGAVMKYTVEDQDPILVGQELGVDIVLDGRIRRIGDNYRVMAQLWRVSDHAILSSYECDEQCSSIFDLEELISDKVVKALVTKLASDEQQFLTKRYTNNKKALDLYMMGRYQWLKRTGAGFDQAIKNFQHAIEADENFAPAYAGLADSYSLMTSNSMSSYVGLANARSAAVRALEIDDDLAEAHTSLAYVRMYFEWDWPGAEKEFKRAMELKPNYTTALQWYAYALACIGRADEAISTMKSALEIDPHSIVTNIDLAIIYSWTRRYDEARGQVRKILEMEPNKGGFKGSLMEVCVATDMYDEYMDEYFNRKALAKAPPDEVARIREIYEVWGWRRFRQHELAEVLERAKKTFVSPTKIAGRYAELGDNEKALEWLDKGYREHEKWMMTLNVDSSFDGVRSDPRFQDLLRRVGLPQRS
jgi:serine/threonine-protein kinase